MFRTFLNTLLLYVYHHSSYTWHYTGFCLYIPETYTEPCQVSKMGYFAKIVNGFQALTIFYKTLYLDVWQGSKYCKWEYAD